MASDVGWLCLQNMFALLRSTMLLNSPEVMYTHMNLDNGNSTHYPQPGYFTASPVSITMNSAVYNGQGSA